MAAWYCTTPVRGLAHRQFSEPCPSSFSGCTDWNYLFQHATQLRGAQNQLLKSTQVHDATPSRQVQFLGSVTSLPWSRYIQESEKVPPFVSSLPDLLYILSVDSNLGDHPLRFVEDLHRPPPPATNYRRGEPHTEFFIFR